MKVYILKESDFEKLLDKLKLESAKRTECIIDPIDRQEVESSAWRIMSKPRSIARFSAFLMRKNLNIAPSA